MIRRPLMVAITITALLLAPLSFAADEIGIFETIYESSLSYSETVEAVEAALDSSNFELHGSHDIRLPDDLQSAMIFVLTSPAYVEAAAAESPRTISAQILRVAVYTWGEEQKTYVNMANPVALAMVFYADSPKYDDLVAAAGSAAADLRGSLTGVPGRALSVAAEPVRSEKHYNNYKGDGPARVMARFRTWDKSQLEIESDSADNFDAVVERVKAALSAGNVADASETVGWETITSIRVRDDAVFLGLTNPYIEDRMVSINSRFRKDGKSDQSPYPGVDHVAALPTDLLIVREGEDTLVLHYGQMWRMQLYFWDSGYRAFTANVGVPGAIANSIEEAVSGAR